MIPENVMELCVYVCSIVEVIAYLIDVSFSQSLHVQEINSAGSLLIVLIQIIGWICKVTSSAFFS